MNKAIKYNVSALTAKLLVVDAVEQEFTGYQIKKAMVQMAISRFFTYEMGKLEFDNTDPFDPEGAAELSLAVYNTDDEIMGYIQAGPAQE